MSIRTPSILFAALLSGLAFQAHALSLSPSSLRMAPGEEATVTLKKVRGSVSIQNSSPATAETRLSSSTITVKALQPGRLSVKVRDRKDSETLSITVTGAAMTVSPSSLSLAVGQSANINVTNPNGSVSATSSNSSVATAILSNNVVTVQGNAAGSATITVRDSSTSKKVAVTVTSNGGGGGGGGGGATNTQGRLLASQCFQCHNAKGGSTGFDRITGESVNEIVGEMKEMQAKAASKPEIMHSQALIYTDAEIYALAQYLASLSGGGSSSRNNRDDD